MLSFHIGLPKTGTTSLQEVIFPYLHSIEKINYDQNISDILATNIAFADLIDSYSNQSQYWHNYFSNEVSQSSFYSNEGILDSDPILWERKLTLFRSFVPEDSRIIITFREPEKYIESLYLQRIFMGDYIDYDDFVLNNNRYSILRNFVGELISFDSINVDAMDYAGLISSLYNMFKNVVLMDMKTCLSLRGIEYLAGAKLTNDQHSSIKSLLLDQQKNKAISSLGLRCSSARFAALLRYGISRFYLSHHEKMIYQARKYLNRRFGVSTNLINTDEQEALKLVNLVKQFLSSRNKAITNEAIIFTLTKGWKTFLKQYVNPISGDDKWKINPKLHYLGEHYESNKVIYNKIAINGITTHPQDLI